MAGIVRDNELPFHVGTVRIFSEYAPNRELTRNHGYQKIQVVAAPEIPLACQSFFIHIHGQEEG